MLGPAGEPFLVPPGMWGGLGPTLVRAMDTSAGEPSQATPAELRGFVQPTDTIATLYRQKQDRNTRHAGYKGRTGIYELIQVDEALRKLIHEGASEAQLESHARTRSAGILDDGWQKCLAGVTSAEEVLRVTRED